LLEGSGIAINRGIITDSHLQTNVPDIFAQVIAPNPQSTYRRKLCTPSSERHRAG
jgi:hypothetical protein